MEKLIPTNIQGLARDTSSRAIINTNVGDYELYRSKRARENVINNVINDIENLKNDMNEIKSMLKQICGK